MTDHVSILKRSQIMAAVKSKDTQPELMVRSLLHKAGYRYKLHSNSLPGKPDMVLPKYKAVIFIHGCFWHGHNCIRSRKPPKTHTVYWKRKIDKNKLRDAQNVRNLHTIGWRVCVIWECALKRRGRIEEGVFVKLIAKWLKAKDTFKEIKGTHRFN